MIDRDGNQVVVTCDGCRTTEEFDRRETPFAAMIERLQFDHGWQIRKGPQPLAVWEHWCADCRRERIPWADRQPSGAQSHKAGSSPAIGARAPTPARPSAGAAPRPSGSAPVLPFTPRPRRKP